MANFLSGEWTVYRLFTEEGEYFGITSNLPRRLAAHRCKYVRHGQDHAYYGFEIVKIDLSYEDACEIEDLLITSLPCINQRRSGLICNKEDYMHNYDVNRRDMKKVYNHEHSMRLYEGERMMFGRIDNRLFRRMFNG